MIRVLKRPFLWAAIFMISFNLSGCAALKTKFTRKNKKEVKRQVYYQLRKYEVKPSFELYEKHYIFWANWHKELTDELGANYKNDIKCIQGIVSNIEDMATLLVDEKAVELTPHIDELKKAESIIKKRDTTKTNRTRVRRILEKERRLIRSKFSPKDMAGFIREDWPDEEIIPQEEKSKGFQNG
ncbi:MAG: hypothetical protein JW994_07920 [Candidatus Omnitrophica bacterium]|nr:hypothetical protein [Candidatus Omnitrophota bacterium]